MPIEHCCVTPAEMRSIYHITTSTLNQVVYTVPADKVFVLTAWTLIYANSINPQSISVWLRRDTTRIAYNRLWQTGQLHHHLDLDPGVPFAAGEQLVLEGLVNTFALHMFYGYERDA
ncbi:hypothetical protein [Nannocystis punicea]|uniref:Uncharacterized protein n=1 Tax=Nannocystis punicea TaxID=2995304 RepID=A0ABY7H9D9_9BACT|nr:hypothetical protein [Nannocystis poenicansa]WAS95705.1 hypothetical protein O0S08_06040 [Nannocystis poenicansa]